MFSVIGDIIAQEVEYGLKRALQPVGPYLRKLAVGMVLIVLSTTFFVLGILAGAGAVFLALAELPYATPAGWSALIFSGAGLLLIMMGAANVRRPH